MANAKNENQSNTKKLISSGITMFLCLIVLLCAAYAWFSKARQVSAKANGIGVMDTVSLKIAATQGGNDVSEIAVPDNLFSMVFDSGVTQVYPGASGYFDMYLTKLGGDTTAGTVTLTPEVIPGGYGADNVLKAPYRTGYDENSAAAAVRFMKGHILLFKNLSNDGIYSGWIDPYNGAPVSFTNGEQVRIYWVWVDYYHKLYTENLLLSSADLQKAAEYFFIVGNYLNPSTLAFSDLLDRRGDESAELTSTRLGHFYDFADEQIGRMINAFSFRITFSRLR